MCKNQNDPSKSATESGRVCQDVDAVALLLRQGCRSSRQSREIFAIRHRIHWQKRNTTFLESSKLLQRRLEGFTQQLRQGAVSSPDIAAMVSLCEVLCEILVALAPWAKRMCLSSTVSPWIVWIFLPKSRIRSGMSITMNPYWEYALPFRQQRHNEV